MNEHWKNKKVAFLGDSITDPDFTFLSAMKYWNYIADSCGLIPLVYGISGAQWSAVTGFAEKLLNEHGNDLDAIFVFMGTNDYNQSLPIGKWFDLKEEEVNHNGIVSRRMHRSFNIDDSTFCGRINMGMKFLKQNFPVQQIILLTPIHRGYACFSETNVQPEESFPNEIGLYIDSYINCIKEAGNIWSVPVIDLNAGCGLFPMMDEYIRYFRIPETDRLHPNSDGHRRIAETILCQMQMYPSTFRFETAHKQ